jgi:ribosomal protein S18 acetylase RimI-like enzyme
MAQTASGEAYPGKISLRPASANDNGFLLHVYESTRLEEVESWGWNVVQQTDFLRMQYEIRKRGYSGSYSSAETSVISIGDSLAGSIIIFRGRGEIRLVDIALLPEFRNRGIGTHLIKMLISEAARSRSSVRLNVLRGNRAALLYGRLGFAAIGGDEMYIEMEVAPAES